jgi:hypothetical protein
MEFKQVLKKYEVSENIEGDKISIFIGIDKKNNSYQIFTDNSTKSFSFGGDTGYGFVTSTFNKRDYTRIQLHKTIVKLLSKALEIAEKELDVDKS